MKAYALLGGPVNLWPMNIKEVFKKAQNKGDVIVGVDLGSLLLEEMGSIPGVALGEFDSLKKGELSKIEKNVKDIRYSNPIKDYTDSELMIRTIFNEYHVDSLVILGATGGRIDHFLVNFFMILNPEIRKFAEKITILDRQNKIQFCDSGNFEIKRDHYFYYFGVAALETVKDLNIIGAKYSLNNFSSDYPRIFSSNEFKPNQDSFILKIGQGLVAVIFSKDINRFDNL